jgi:hypothetical protein
MTLFSFATELGAEADFEMGCTREGPPPQAFLSTQAALPPPPTDPDYPHDPLTDASDISEKYGVVQVDF